jgi:hypothetical protein
MNWEEIGAIGQVLGSIAVFITLGYLAVQVRHARKEVQRSIAQSRGEIARELILNRVNNPWLNALNVKAHRGLGEERSPFAEALMERAGLTLEEGVALNWEQQAWWLYRAQVIADVDELTPAERASFDLRMRAFHELPLTRLWYESSKATLNADAVRYIDKLLAQPS